MISPKGHVDHYNSARLRTAFEKIFSLDKIKIAVDLSGVNYMSSAGIGVLMSFQDMARDKGGDVAIFAPMPRVKAAFRALAFESYATREEALKLFSPPA